MVELYVNSVAREIANASLDIGAIKIDAKDPFLWASGYYMPIYNDNRLLLGSAKHRNLVVDAFSELILRDRPTNDIPSVIVGTSTAGIAPAASLATAIGAVLVLFDEKGAPWKYSFSSKPLPYSRKDIDLVVSTAPWSIPEGVNIANKLNLPFAYVRQEPKAHGMKQSIEGIVKSGQRALLLDLMAPDDYSLSAIASLNEKGVQVNSTEELTFRNNFSPVDLKDRACLVIEDLISTGGSSAREVAKTREAGGICNTLYSIFGYGLERASTAFGGLVPACKFDSALTYDVLLEEAVKRGLSANDLTLLKDWRADPFAWGEKNGFAKKENK